MCVYIYIYIRNSTPTPSSFALLLFQMESLLVSQPGVNPSYMTESEFLTAANELVLTVYDRLQRHLFKEAVAYVTQLDGIPDGVPILRLARILDGIRSRLSPCYDK